MKHEILELKALIEQLRATDTNLSIFGAKSHRYRIGPTLAEPEIMGFEQKYNIALPEDYRLYLQLVGDGNGESFRQGTGPWQRGGAGPEYGVYPLAEMYGSPRMSEPFSFEVETEIPDEPLYQNWDENIPGAIEISTAGCGSHTHLIVSGPKRGEIWGGSDLWHFLPISPSFAQWMRSWAEQSLKLLEAQSRG